MIASIGFTINIHTPYVPDIPSLTKFSTNVAYNKIHPSTHEHLHTPVLIQNEWNNKCSPYNKYGGENIYCTHLDLFLKRTSFICTTILNIFLKSMKEKIKKNIHNFNNVVKVII